MKKIAIIAVFIFLLNKIYSQDYQPFDSTTVWGAEFAQKIQSSCYTLENKKYFIKGYELNNGNKWLKVFYNLDKKWHPASAGFCYSISTVGTLPAYYSNVFLGYLYNDSINKRVYFTTTLTANYAPPANKVLYDFNKVLGDTIYTNPITSSNYNAKFKIHGIDSILFSGKYHKRFLTTSAFILSPGYISFTEGIGSSIDPFDPIKANGFENWSNLLCFSSPVHSISVTSHTIFTNGGCANLIMNISENKGDRVGIYPNPASDKLSVVAEQFVSEKTDYEIINLVGQLKQKGELKENNNDIDLQTFSDGIYFINFYKEGRIISSKKIIVAKN